MERTRHVLINCYPANISIYYVSSLKITKYTYADFFGLFWGGLSEFFENPHCSETVPSGEYLKFCNEPCHVEQRSTKCTRCEPSPINTDPFTLTNLPGAPILSWSNSWSSILSLHATLISFKVCVYVCSSLGKPITWSYFNILHVVLKNKSLNLVSYL